MSEWILLKSESELETMARALRRKCRGHYYTNYFFINSTRNDDLRYTEMFWMAEGDNLYAIERKDDFYQLFYFVGDPDSVRLDLPPSVEKGVLTCEVYEEEGKEKQGCVLEKLYEEGFCDYKKYHYYERRGGDFLQYHPEELDTAYQAGVEELSAMYDIFDPYSDDLPLRKAFPEFLASMNIVSCAVDGQYGGSFMYKKNGWGNSYLFVLSNFFGLGVPLFSAGFAEYIREHPNRVARATIEDHNARSIRLHKAFGYERTRQYHTVLIRRN